MPSLGREVKGLESCFGYHHCPFCYPLSKGKACLGSGSVGGRSNHTRSESSNCSRADSSTCLSEIQLEPGRDRDGTERLPHRLNPRNLAVRCSTAPRPI